MKAIILLFALVCSTVMSGQDFTNAKYLSKFEAATQAERCKGTVSGILRLDELNRQVRFINQHGSSEFAINYSGIKRIAYQPAVKSRAEGVRGGDMLVAWPLLLKKVKNHYLLVQYDDLNGVAQSVWVRLSKGNYREILAALEQQTALKVDMVEARIENH